MNSNAKTILGIMAAGAVGVAIGMLLAPEKGSDMRKSLKEKAEDMNDTLCDLIESGKELIESGKEKLAGVKDQAMSKAEDLKNEGKNEFNKAKSALS